MILLCNKIIRQTNGLVAAQRITSHSLMNKSG